jgi:hypothetical protein
MLIEHYNPRRYCYLQVVVLHPGLTNLAPQLEAFQSNSLRRGSRLMTALGPEAVAVVEGRHANPFRYLGPHVEDGVAVVRVLLPDAREVTAVGSEGTECPLTCIHEAGLFVGRRPGGRYRLRVRFGAASVELEDPYRFSPVLSDLDLHLLGEGTHLDSARPGWRAISDFAADLS